MKIDLTIEKIVVTYNFVPIVNGLVRPYYGASQLCPQDLLYACIGEYNTRESTIRQKLRFEKRKKNISACCFRCVVA